LGVNDFVVFNDANVFGGSFFGSMLGKPRRFVLLRRSSESLRKSLILLVRLSVIVPYTNSK
jgi:hypothetical protein